MKKDFRFTIVTAALACWMGLGGNPSLAAATEIQAGACGPDVIPVVLTGEADSTGYIQPVCLKCKKLTVARQTGSTGGSQGVLALTYFDEVRPRFDGAIVLTLLMSDDSERVVTIDEVHLEEGEHAWWSIADDSQVNWANVDMVWIEFVPGE